MKKSHRHFPRYNAFFLAFMFVRQLVCAQVSNPSSWSSFVTGDENVLTEDTFRLQTFSGLPVDNWSYTTDDDLSIVDLSETESILTGRRSEYGLKLTLGSEVSFDHYSVTPYDTVKIAIRKGGVNLMTGEDLMIKAYRPEEPADTCITIVDVSSDNYFKNFNITYVWKNPQGLDFIVSDPSENTLNGYYYIDSVCAIGAIQTYSLFTGSGAWGDTVCWSHLPAYRQRSALINGDVTIADSALCRHVYLAEGSIEIASDAKLYLDTLTIYSDDTASTAPALSSAGELHVSDHLSVVKTFEEKGKWYFISLPFDVYASGIDSNFQLSDDTESLSGNYFYLQTYDGDKRASQQSQSDNWTVVSKDIDSSEPILEKNKGYLIALDAEASTQSITFTSETGDIPTDFGRNGAVDIEVSINESSEDDTHNGWYLCGNPLPAPLALKQLDGTEALDGYAYVYDGSAYKSYSLTGSYAIPAYSAFFVKATNSTTLSISQTTTTTKSYELVSANMPLSDLRSEPQLEENRVTAIEDPITTGSIHYHLREKTLSIERLSVKGEVRLYDLSGHLVFATTVDEGSSSLALPVPSGIYILNIQAGEELVQGKHLL